VRKMALYRFVEWRDAAGNVLGTDPALTVMVDADVTLIAYYEEVVAPEYTLMIEPTAGGTTNPPSGDYPYTEGTTVTVTAIPDAGYAFDYWLLDGIQSTTNPISVLMDRNHALSAHFVALPTEYTLTINTTAGGSTDPAPESYLFPEGSIVNVTAIPDSGYLFDHWILDEATRTENPINVTMNTNHTLTAYFEAIMPPEYTLMIEPTSGGTTDPAPGDYSYMEGATVTVIAIPDSGYAFDYWLLDGIPNPANPIDVLMDKNHALAAYFKTLPPPEYTLTIATTAGGTTDPAPGDYTYVAGTTVKVTAIPVPDYNFNHWELDGIIYASNPINVIMDGYHSLTAYFSEIPPPPPETFHLTISSSVGGTTEPTPGIYEHDKGITINVTATPENGYYFNHWELDGAVKLENPINVTMDEDHTLVAVFTSEPPPPTTIFETWWKEFTELLEQFGLPIPPKPPAPPPLPFEE